MPRSRACTYVCALVWPWCCYKCTLISNQRRKSHTSIKLRSFPSDNPRFLEIACTKNYLVISKLLPEKTSNEELFEKWKITREMKNNLRNGK